MDARCLCCVISPTSIKRKLRGWPPKGSVVDGASIPKIFWSFVGGPFEGQYRNASIVHDTECDAKTYAWQAVHRMFYNASRAGGVGWIKAHVLYAAVYYFGPRWKVVKPSAVSVAAADAKEYLTRLIVLLRRDYGRRTITPEAIEGLSFEQLKQQVSDKDPDLATVRSLLAKRESISASTVTGRAAAVLLKSVDDALYFDNKELPVALDHPIPSPS